MRLLYGLERVPRSIDFDDPRLPGIEVGPSPLRLNTEPVPPAILAGAGESHAARFAATIEWLQGQCGDYAVPQRRFVAAYMAAVVTEVEANGPSLGRYDGLYARHDWTWSALRPLPRAWIKLEGGPIRREMAFWDGQELVQIDCATSLDALPPPFRAFWRGEILPRSPFRRPALMLTG